MAMVPINRYVVCSMKVATILFFPLHSDLDHSEVDLTDNASRSRTGFNQGDGIVPLMKCSDLAACRCRAAMDIVARYAPVLFFAGQLGKCHDAAMIPSHGFFSRGGTKCFYCQKSALKSLAMASDQAYNIIGFRRKSRDVLKCFIVGPRVLGWSGM